MEIDPNLRAQRDEILKIAARHGASNVRIFGSVARDDADEASDVDLLVDMAPGRTLFDLGGLNADLEALLQRRIDLVTPCGLRARIRERVVREALPLREIRRNARSVPALHQPFLAHGRSEPPSRTLTDSPPVPEQRMNPLSPDPLLDLVHRWHAGDAAAGNEILIEIEPWLRREVSRAMSGKPVNAQDSADVTQQAIANFLESGPRFVPRSGAEFRALLRRIALNELVDQSRKGKHRDGRKAETLFGASGSMSDFGGVVPTVERPSHIAAAGEEWNWLRLALQYLEPDERRLLIASEVEGLSWADVADELGLASADAARVKSARLKPRLANLILKLQAGRSPEGGLSGDGV